MQTAAQRVLDDAPLGGLTRREEEALRDGVCWAAHRYRQSADAVGDWDVLPVPDGELVLLWRGAPWPTHTGDEWRLAMGVRCPLDGPSQWCAAAMDGPRSIVGMESADTLGGAVAIAEAWGRMWRQAGFYAREQFGPALPTEGQARDACQALLAAQGVRRVA